MLKSLSKKVSLIDDSTLCFEMSKLLARIVTFNHITGLNINGRFNDNSFKSLTIEAKETFDKDG